MIDTTEFDSQLVSSLRYWSSALRSGYSVKQSFEILAQHAPEPTSGEFRRVLDDVANGISLTEAVTYMKERVGSPHFDRVIDQMMEQRQVGDNLADRLDTLNAELRKALGNGSWSSDFPEFGEN